MTFDKRDNVQDSQGSTCAQGWGFLLFNQLSIEDIN